MHIQEQTNSTQSNSLVIQENVSLGDKNWFGTGGAARFYCEPPTAQQFSNALKHAHDHHLNLFILGQGANILISDNGFSGMIIKPRLQTITILSFSDDNI